MILQIHSCVLLSRLFFFRAFSTLLWSQFARVVIHGIDQYRWVVGSIFGNIMAPTLKLRFKQSHLGMWKCDAENHSKTIQVVVSKPELLVKRTHSSHRPFVPGSIFREVSPDFRKLVVFAIRERVHPDWGPLSDTFAACRNTGIPRSQGMRTVMIFEHCKNLFAVD